MGKLSDSVIAKCTLKQFQEILADPEAKDDWTETLFLAVRENRTDLLECLAIKDYVKFEKCMNKGIEYEGGLYTPLKYAYEHSNETVIEKIKQFEEQVNFLSTAIRKKCEPEAFEKLLSESKQFTQNDWNRAVVTAIDCEQIALLEILAKSDFNKFKCSLEESSAFKKDGWTVYGYPLERAAYANKPDVVKTLVNLGADVNFNWKKGIGHNAVYRRTALHIAAEYGYETLIKFLLEKNAYSFTYHGNFPITLAFENNKEKAYISAQGGKVYEDELLNLLCSSSNKAEDRERAHSLLKNITIKAKENKTNEESKSVDVQQLLAPEAGKEFLEKFPNNEMWRFFVDGEKQEIPSENGWCGYEDREPGCIKFMYEAFQMACLNKDKGVLTKDLCISIHKKAGNHFKNEVNEISDSFNQLATYPLISSVNLSLDGYFELTKEPYKNWNLLSWVPSGERLNVASWGGSEKVLQEQFEQYNEAQKSTPASDRKKILENIILLASSYSRLHPRRDANNRTATIILNSELIKHGFSPAILKNPNRLEGFSQAELLNEVYQGMQNVRHVIKFGCYPNGKSTVEFQKSISNGQENLRNIPDTIAEQWQKLKERLKEIAEQSSNKESQKPFESNAAAAAVATSGLFAENKNTDMLSSLMSRAKPEVACSNPIRIDKQTFDIINKVHLNSNSENILTLVDNAIKAIEACNSMVNKDKLKFYKAFDEIKNLAFAQQNRKNNP